MIQVTPLEFYAWKRGRRGGRVKVREVVPCEWNATGLLVGTACGHEFTTGGGGLPADVLFCPFCGGLISGGRGLETEEPEP